MIPLLFYVVALAFNLLTTLHDRGYAWSAVIKATQIIPFLYGSYHIYLFVVALVPMQGRSGFASNPDILIAGLVALGTVLSLSFVIPLINTFRRPSTVIFTLLAINAVGMYLATSTQIGFPYRPKTNVQRVSYMAVRNRFYEYDGTLSNDESGYLFNFYDRRMEKPFLGTRVNLTGLQSMTTRCQKHMMCGMPYVRNHQQNRFLPRTEPVVPPGSTTLELVNKTMVNATVARFVFEMTGPPYMSIFFQPYEDVKIVNLSFPGDYLQKPPPYPLAYHIYIVCGKDRSPIVFSIDLMKSDADFEVPVLQLGTSGRWDADKGDAETARFASTFPSFTMVDQWIASYERYIY
ncbi:endoplasmic reticulum metallopeptidase 1-like [Drosophila busckii]|uniref:endoplasmic reticulum metallopeptidase 1-like n=1 Tax=Drosophila busckii TaxID=30019 RepID=UPI001432D8DD|nr:endoplasmic reticulum metallopeptidase 1-like [Drosophila busckii]